MSFEISFNPNIEEDPDKDSDRLIFIFLLKIKLFS